MIANSIIENEDWMGVFMMLNNTQEEIMRTRQTRQGWLVIGAIACIWLCAGNAFGPSGAQYQMTGSVLDAGGGSRTSEHYSVYDSLGQVSGADVSTSSHYQHIPGFYADDVTAWLPPTPPPTTTPAPIPEPGTLMLFGSGLVGLVMLMRRKSKTE